MALKETQGSLRTYFVVAGLFGVLMGLKDLSDIHSIDLSILTVGQLAALYVPMGSRLLLGIGFVLAGAGFKADRVTVTTFIKQMLVVSGVMLFVDGALITAAFGPEIGERGIIGAVIGLAITIYLYRTVARFAAEAAAKAGVAPPPPEARVI